MPQQVTHSIIIIGVSGSGKTTVARGLAAQRGIMFLDADDFHSPDARAQMAAGIALTDAQREPWIHRLVQALQQHHPAVLAYSGLRAAHRDLMRASGVPLRFVHLHATQQAIAQRLNSRRDHYMPASLLASQFDAWQAPSADEGVLSVDSDGTPTQVLARVVAALG